MSFRAKPTRRNAGFAHVERLTIGDGRSLCVRRRAGEGEPTVLLHGLLDSSEGWAELCGALDGPWIAFDLPGFGYSDLPEQGSVQSYARDIADGLRILGVERFALVGHSLGGAVATALAELMPDAISRLVLFAPVGFGHIRLAEVEALPLVRTVVQTAMPFALRNRLAVAFGYATMVSDGLAPDAALVDRVVAGGTRLAAGAQRGIRAVAEAGRGSGTFANRRVGYAGPVHAVFGDHDRLVPAAHAEALRRSLPQARLEVWRGMGHHPLRERFSALVALVRESPVSSAHAASGPLPGVAEAA